MKKGKWISFILLWGMLSGCHQPKPTLYRQLFKEGYFNTNSVFGEYSTSQDLYQKHVVQYEQELKRYHELFDIYHEYAGINNIMTINRMAGIQPVKVDQEIIDLLQLAKQFYTYTNGELDVTQGAVLKLWHDYRTDGISKNEEGLFGKVPSQQEVNEQLACRGFDHIEINETQKTMWIKNPCVQIDVGAIGKGYATEKIAQKLEEAGVKHGYIDNGGNLRMIGSKPDQEVWRIGIRNPKPSLIQQEVAMIDKYQGSISTVTSGSSERYYLGEDGQMYHHIIDPKTGFPLQLYLSVSIFTQDSGVADCLSTALFNVSIEEGKKIIETYEEKMNQDIEVVWLMEPSKVQGDDVLVIENKDHDSIAVAYTDGLSTYFKF